MGEMEAVGATFWRGATGDTLLQGGLRVSTEASCQSVPDGLPCTLIHIYTLGSPSALPTTKNKGQSLSHLLEYVRGG